MKELKFKVESFRRIPNPYRHEGDSSNNVGDPKPAMYFAVCDVKDLPDDIPMETNPREQNLNTRVSRAIRETLLDETSLDFYLLNRGMLLSAKDVSFNNYTNELTILFEDERVHGNVDGGHTYKLIKENRDGLSAGEQFIKLEILTGIEDIFTDLAEARNRSVALKEQSLADLRKELDMIKIAIADQPYADEVIYKENSDGTIDVRDLIALLSMFDISKYPQSKWDEQPIRSYSAKQTCLKDYLNYFEKYGDTHENPYIKMQGIATDVFCLYDQLEEKIQNYYSADKDDARYGRTKGVICKDSKTKFLHKTIKYISPIGFLYPILGSLRSLVFENEDGQYAWKKNPYEFLDQLGPELVNTTVDRSRSLGGNPNAVGKDRGNWKQLFMTTLLALNENSQ